MDLTVGARMAPRTGALALPGLAALLAGAAVLQGAYWWGQLVLLATGAVALWGITRGRAASRVVLAGLGAIGAGMILSGAANGWPVAARMPMLTLVVAAATYAVAARAAANDGVAAVLDAVAGVGAIVAVIGIAGVAWHLEPWGLRADTWRLASTLTYQNAAAGLLALALGPAIALASGAPNRVRRAMLVVIGVGLAATLSRGGYLAAATVVGVMATTRAVSWRTLARPAAGGLLGAASLLPATLGFGWSGPVAMLGLGAGILIGTGEPRKRRRIARAGVVLLACIVVAAVPPTALGARFTFSSTDRARVWGATIEQLDEHLAFGTGPGTYELVAPAGELLVRTKHAHNEYLQTLSETGIVGTAALMAGIGVMAFALRRARPRGNQARTWWAACAAGCAGFMVHAGFDFVWHIPVLVAMAMTLLAAGMHAGEEES